MDDAGDALTLDALTLDGVSVRYSASAPLALSGVNLRLRPGDVAALLGPNGAGKSTLLRVAAGLVRPTDGTARIGGSDVWAWDRRARARKVALVAQSGPVPRGFRVRDVVAMGRAPHQGVWMQERDEDRAAVADAIERCDLNALVDRSIEALSGGEQRLVAIARALAQRPRVLLLDEPTASSTSAIASGSTRCWPRWPPATRSLARSRRTISTLQLASPRARCSCGAARSWRPDRPPR